MEPNELIAAWESRAVNLAYHPEHCGGATAYRTAAHELRAALAAPPVEQQAPAKVYLVATGETHNGLETYTRHDAPVPLADQEVLASAQAAQPAPQAGAAEHLWSLVEAYSSARTVACDPASTVTAQEHAHARMLRMEVTLRQAFAAHPNEQPSQDAERLDFLDAFLRQAGGGVSISGAGPVRQIIDAAQAQAQGGANG